MIRGWLVLVLILAGQSVGRTQTATELQSKLLDSAAFAQWSAAGESPIPAASAKNGPQEIVWTADQRIEFRGVEFGTSREPGTRHLRIGFTEPLTIGAVLTRGGGLLSVLKADAAYPGPLNDESLWQPAERISDQQPAVRDDYAVWTLPVGTKTRALRFTHQAEAADQNPAGWLGGVWLLPARVTNLAPQALAASSARPESAGLLNDQSHNQHWSPWDNGERGAALTVSAERPERITLTWPQPVKLNSVGLLWAGMSAADVEEFIGPADAIPATAPANAWRKIAGSTTIDPKYPLSLGPNWIDFGRTIETRAIRVKITAGPQAKGIHSHLSDKLQDGRRVWLGELLAISPLGDAPLSSAVIPRESTESPPPIPVKFRLPEAGVVTLVIEDEAGTRICNLVSETPFPAGDNTAWWDGSDDLLRDPDAAKHGLYHIPTRFVAPGKHTVRGLWRKPLKLAYEMSVYSAGKPAWPTADNTGGWMTNHTPPTSLAFVPGSRTKDGEPLLFMGAFVAEGGHGLQWVREDGVKVGGQGWIGGNWTGAPTLATDLGPQAIAEHLCYAGSVWEGELRLTAKTADFQDKPVLKLKLGDDPPPDRLPKGAMKPAVLKDFDGGDREFVLAGIAAHNGIIVCSMTRQNQLLFIDARTGEIQRKAKVENPRGLTFDSSGRLLVLAGTELLNFVDEDAATAAVSEDLTDPRHVALDAAGNFVISDQGDSHQIKVFSPKGRLLRKIGEVGEPSVGKYDAWHMNHPHGVAVDSQGRVWVAENDFHPKRVSVWSADGKLVRAFYGPGEYGGGGVLDSEDKTKFFYKGLEFKLDWETGRDELVRVFYRPSPLFEAHYGHYSPDTPLYPASRPGRRFFTSCFTHNPTSGDHVSFIWVDDQPGARLVSALGNAHEWAILKTEPFHSRWPQGVDPRGETHRNAAAFVWSDENGDAQPQPDEVTMTKAACYGVTTLPDLSQAVARFNDQAVRFAVIGYSKSGAPRFSLEKPEVIGSRSQSPRSSGGDQVLFDPEGWAIQTVAPLPFSPFSLGGSFRGTAKWSYPSPWPGLHASHEAAVPDRPGMVIGHTRLLGGLIRPQGDAGPIFGINANMGNMVLMTADGLFVGTLFHDIRQRPNWSMPTATRGMDVGNVSLHDENFWPSLTQTKDGAVYVVDGARVSLVRVDGLDSIQRIESQPLIVSTKDLQKAQDWFAAAEVKRQAAAGSGNLRVVLRKEPPVVDGKLDDWPVTTEWAAIDRRGTKANFNSDAKPYDASAAATIAGERLFVAWKTTEKDLLKNSGETPQALFKTGGALDLMLATDAAAKEGRTEPVPGDQRLLVAEVSGKPRAWLYRARVPGTKDAVSFSSPWRTIQIDEVVDVTDQITFAADGTGKFEISVPLELLKWKPESGTSYRADLGVLRGDGKQTTQRVYWSNKATAITADVPSEAELTPRLWGRWQLVTE